MAFFTPQRSIGIYTEEMDNSVFIKTAMWQEQRDCLLNVRREVFIDEQQVPEELELDDEDSSATHFLVTSGDEAIGCGRLCTSGQIGRVAIRQPWRGKGVGIQLMKSIEKTAANLGMREVFLHSQLQANPFYEALGYVAYGEPFMDAGIPHQAMKKFL